MSGPERIAPGVSVVVPVLGRVPSTERMLASLRAAAERCPEPVEIILIDDSGPTDAARHREHCDRHGARYLRGPRHVGAKRNLGVRHASHDLLLFTDSDCRATPDLLRIHVAAIRDAPETAGLAGPTIVEVSPTRVFRIMRRSHLLHADLERPALGGPLEWATTSNLLVRKDAFEQVGGFVERSLLVAGGEDVDLGVRLTRAGLKLRSQPDALVVHDRLSSDTLHTIWRRLYGYGRSEQWLIVVHPDRRAPRWNPVVAVGASGAVALAAAPSTGGLSFALVPATAAIAIGLRASARHEAGSGLRGAANAVACAILECSFDIGAAVASFQLRRPGLLFAGFRPAPEGGPDA
ncbi:glycosyltransferase family 2 protein [Glycomyces buryatensis]|uniref:Glycosyltransferase n=1 Tax=Glycomyces buryatensis TaxID=2570927 RepID=A0A4S8Q110_9ACTN|nr:glycosyltransferase [Glycomyces buryatensis]THV37630.1 glycosyltransferase [Glycomyces buryatensis]